MKFTISRASGSEGEPVDGAQWEIVSVESESEGNPTSEGWVINLETMDDLIRFVEDYGDVIIHPACTEGARIRHYKYPFMVIYDDYVE